MIIKLLVAEDEEEELIKQLVFPEMVAVLLARAVDGADQKAKCSPLRCVALVGRAVTYNDAVTFMSRPLKTFNYTQLTQPQSLHTAEAISSLHTHTFRIWSFLL